MATRLKNTLILICPPLAGFELTGGTETAAMNWLAQWPGVADLLPQTATRHGDSERERLTPVAISAALDRPHRSVLTRAVSYDAQIVFRFTTPPAVH